MTFTPTPSAGRTAAESPLAAVRGCWGDSLVRNSILVMATTGTNALLGYLFWIAAARLLSPDDVGRATATISAMNLAALLATLGVGTALVAQLPRLGSNEDRSRHVTAALLYTAAAGLVAGLVLVFGLPLLSGGSSAVATWVKALIVLGVMAQVWGIVIDQLFVAERRAAGMLVRNGAFGALKLVLLVVGGLTLVGGDRTIVTAWIAASTASLLIVGATSLRRLDQPLRAAPQGAIGEIRRMAGPALLHHLAVLGGELPMFVLPVIVLARSGASGAAFFYTTWMVGSLFFTISAGVSHSLFAEGTHTPEQAGRQLRRAMRLIAVLLVPAMLAMALLGDRVLSVFGADYAAAGYPLLLILVVSALPDAVTNVGVARWRVQGRNGRVAALNIVMAGLTITATWVLVPQLGIAGAGWAWLLAQSAGVAIVTASGLWDRNVAHLEHSTHLAPRKALSCAS